jgi:Protein of unknown function (DUF3089)
MLFLRYLIAICILVLTAATSSHAADFKPPSRPFADSPQPPAPNYSSTSAWVVWPGRASSADIVPRGIPGGIVQNPGVDVFFIHPTTYLSNATWNARFDEGGATGLQLEKGVLRYQTSVFNSCCRIYAPRYRQATISAFLRPGQDSALAYDLAYGDVERAFDYYIANQNKGRPFILASHSQGSLHTTRLLQARIIARHALRQRLVAAYVVGASLPQNMEYTGLPPCNSPRQTRCIVNWNSTAPLVPLAIGRRIMVTYGEGRYQTVGGKTWLCVNPLTWRAKGVAAAALNRGALPSVANTAALPRAVPAVTGATCARGRLVVKLPRAKRKGFIDPLTKLGTYHNHDYNLFYASIRQNAMDRVEAFLKR